MRMSVPDHLRGLGALGLAALLSACKPASVAPPAAPPAPPPEVQTVHPSRGAITRHVTLPGQVKAYQEATLYAKVAGYLKTITVDKGDPVSAGDLLADIEVPEILADLAKYTTEVEVAELDYRRLSESQRKAPDLVTPITVDEARGRLEIAKANVDRTRALLQYARITAPFAGVITRRLVDPGAFIPAATSSSAAQNAAIVTLADFKRIRLQVAVPELDAPLVKPGQPVRFTVEGLRGRAFDATITRFAYALDEGSRTMLAEIEMANPDLELRPGMYAVVRIGLETRNDALRVPVGALVTEKAGTFVFTIADRKAKKTRVQTGFNDGTNVEIRDGLAPDQQVVLLGKQELRDGQAVEVSQQP